MATELTNSLTCGLIRGLRELDSTAIGSSFVGPAFEDDGGSAKATAPINPRTAAVAANHLHMGNTLAMPDDECDVAVHPPLRIHLSQPCAYYAFAANAWIFLMLNFPFAPHPDSPSGISGRNAS